LIFMGFPEAGPWQFGWWPVIHILCCAWVKMHGLQIGYVRPRGRAKKPGEVEEKITDLTAKQGGCYEP